MTVPVTCACCRRTTLSPALVDRDGYQVGPKVAICSACDGLPSSVLWQRIAVASAHPHAAKPVHSFQLPSMDEVRARA